MFGGHWQDELIAPHAVIVSVVEAVESTVRATQAASRTKPGVERVFVRDDLKKIRPAKGAVTASVACTSL